MINYTGFTVSSPLLLATSSGWWALWGAWDPSGPWMQMTYGMWSPTLTGLFNFNMARATYDEVVREERREGEGMRWEKNRGDRGECVAVKSMCER